VIGFCPWCGIELPTEAVNIKPDKPAGELNWREQEQAQSPAQHFVDSPPFASELYS